MHSSVLRRIRAAWFVLAAVFLPFAVMTATGMFKDAQLAALGDALYLVVLTGGGILCLARALTVRAQRGGWLALGLSLVIWALADLYWIAFLADAANAPYPSPADWLWLISYPPMAWGLWLLLKGHRGTGADGGGAWLDGLVAALAGSAVAAATLLAAPLEVALDGEPAVFLTNLAYPVGDLLLFGVALASLASAGWRPGRTAGLLAAGLLLRAVADFVYLDQATRGTYTEFGLLDVAWPASSLIIAAAAFHVQDLRAKQLDWRVYATPFVFVALALAILVYDHYHRVSELTLVLAAAAVAAAAVRMVWLFREMLATSRREALTDPLTGLGNRRALMNDLEQAEQRALAGERLLLVSYDLNGFKRYNDSFGHPAGDALLGRLGTSLARATGPHGAAYRLGGDEFCVLLPESERSRVETTVASLGERGEGFTVSTAHGVVEMPEDATDLRAVLHLADQRMYASKLHRRAEADDTVQALVRTLRESEPEVETHLGHVGELAREVALELGLSVEEIDEVTRAARLHDLGKLAIPDAILHKPGPLDADEWEYMHKHTLIGERIVSSAPPLIPIARIIRSSHERWDGSGYPDGLAGEEIPRGARIVFACDAFDAMTNDRSYRKASTEAEALEELRRNSGTQFEPLVVAAVIKVVEARALSLPVLAGGNGNLYGGHGEA